MNRKELEQAVEKDLEPILSAHQYELVDVEFVKEGPNYFLRIYIDKEDGVTIEDCRVTSRAIEAVLDEKDLIKEAYTLEVSSPGLDRILKKDREFIRYAGRLVDIKLYKAIDKQKQLTATLVEKKEDTLYLDDEGTALEIPMQNVASVRLAIVF